MGILANGMVISVGVLVGSLIKKIEVKKFAIFGICVAMISLVGFIENVFQVNGTGLKGEHLYTVIFSLIIGNIIGEALQIDKKVNGVKVNAKSESGVIESAMFFAIGGLQISGPILLAVSGDNSLLFLKCAIDLPFAVMFGTIYGKRAGLSAIPVVVIQLIIAVIAYSVGEFISAQMLSCLCSVGYVTLFFSGFNMLVDQDKKIKTVNLLPAIPLVIILNLVITLLGR